MVLGPGGRDHDFQTAYSWFGRHQNILNNPRKFHIILNQYYFGKFENIKPWNFRFCGFQDFIFWTCHLSIFKILKFWNFGTLTLLNIENWKRCNFETFVFSSKGIPLPSNIIRTCHETLLQKRGLGRIETATVLSLASSPRSWGLAQHCPREAEQNRCAHYFKADVAENRGKKFWGEAHQASRAAWPPCEGRPSCRGSSVILFPMCHVTCALS